MEKQEEIREKVKEDPDAYKEMFDYAAQMFENNPDNFIGYIGYMISSQGKTGEQKLEMIDKPSPTSSAPKTFSLPKRIWA